MKRLLISDLDNTIVGDDLATYLLNQYLRVCRMQFVLVYATGRTFESAKQLTLEKDLLSPDYWITGVGTEIYHRDELDRAWSDRISKDWDRESIAKLVKQFHQLIPQPESEQNPWKLSYCLKEGADPEVINTLRMRILLRAALNAQIIFSSKRDVDILPMAADKGQAASYLQEKLKIPNSKILVCGDSGNDVSLFQRPVYGIIVGNAQPELLNWYQRHGKPYHHLARTSYAYAILEGMQKFGFLNT